MDSKLLNPLHDDPFENAFSKFDNENPNLWTNNNDPIGRQLNETLHGILPLAGNEAVGEMYDTALILSDGLRAEELLQDGASTSALVYEENGELFYDSDFVEQHLLDGGDGIEIVTLDPTAIADDYDSDDEDAGEDDDDDGEDALNNYDDNEMKQLKDSATLADIGRCHRLNGDDDAFSQYSESSFRTRTDSSSIGDYESHTSDYDDDEEDDDLAVGIARDDRNAPREGSAACLVQNLYSAGPESGEDFFSTALLATDDLILEADLKLPLIDFTLPDGSEERKNRTISTNTIGSDVDGLGVPIDASTFDLADFITKDDFIVNTAAKTCHESVSLNRGGVVQLNGGDKAMLTKPKAVDSDSDSDSDVIVDVETIEVADDNDTAFVDHVNGDPSEDERSCARTNGLSKNTKLHPRKSTNFKERHRKEVPTAGQQLKGVAATCQGSGKVSDPGTEQKKNVSCPSRSVEIATQYESDIAIVEEEQKSEPPVQEAQPSPVKQAIKRKLNLEEYKMRRNVGNGDHNALPSAGMPIATVEKQGPTVGPSEPKRATLTNLAVTPTCPLVAPKKHSEAITSIVRSLKEQQQQSQTTATDPITEARKKVLRMQEIKRAQQIKIIDSAVSAKVPRVTKVLPLTEIMSSGSQQADALSNVAASLPQSNPDYEEIIIVSVSCNTDISIPPLNALLKASAAGSTAQQRASVASRSLLKSSVLLQKVQSAEKAKLATNSLIASIQNAVVMKSLPPVVQPTAAPIAANVNQMEPEPQHGENKIIMHLRRDRVRQNMHAIATQTDFLPEFPIFPMPTSRRKKRGYRKRQQSRSASDGSYSSAASSSPSGEDNDNDNATTRRVRQSPARSSCADSSGMAAVSGADTAGGYSSRSSRRHRSSISSSYSETEREARHRRQRRTSYKQRTRRHSRASSVASSASSSSSSSCSSSVCVDRRLRNRSRQRTRSRSPLYRSGRRNSGQRHERSGGHHRANNNSRAFVDRNVSQPAVEERRIVYVGRIEQDTNKEMLRKKFSAYGGINQITIHYKDTGMKYGFVTFERSQDAFAAIDSSHRDSQIKMYDVSFGGRRAFCRASYADLDNAGINTYQSYVFPKANPPPSKEDSFEALLLQVKAKMNANKTPPSANAVGVKGDDDNVAPVAPPDGI